MRAPIVALTGGIGAGKTTVGRILQQLGCALVDADRLARDALTPGSEGLRQVVAMLGPEVLREDGALDRERVADLVFGDAQARHALESIVHPYVRREMAERVDALQSEGGPRLIVLDIPLLFESNLQSRYQTIVVVDCEEQRRIDRLVRLRGLSESAVRARIAAQIPLTEKVARADHVIDNNGTLEGLRDETRRVVDAILRR